MCGCVHNYVHMHQVRDTINLILRWYNKMYTVFFWCRVGSMSSFQACFLLKKDHEHGVTQWKILTSVWSQERFQLHGIDTKKQDFVTTTYFTIHILIMRIESQKISIYSGGNRGDINDFFQDSFCLYDKSCVHRK